MEGIIELIISVFAIWFDDPNTERERKVAAAGGALGGIITILIVTFLALLAIILRRDWRNIEEIFLSAIYLFIPALVVGILSALRGLTLSNREGGTDHYFLVGFGYGLVVTSIIYTTIIVILLSLGT